MTRLELHFIPTPDDFVTTFRDYAYRDRRTWVTLAVWLVATLVIIYFFLRGTFGGIFPGGLVFIFPVYFLFRFLNAPNRIGKQVTGNPVYLSEVTWRVYERGLRITNREEEIELPWDEIMGVREITDHYLIFQKSNPRIFQFIPKRAFENPEQEEAFREWLQQHLS